MEKSQSTQEGNVYQLVLHVQAAVTAPSLSAAKALLESRSRLLAGASSTEVLGDLTVDLYTPLVTVVKGPRSKGAPKPRVVAVS